MMGILTGLGKKAALAVTISLAATLLAACSGGSEPEPEPTAAPAAAAPDAPTVAPKSAAPTPAAPTAAPKTEEPTPTATPEPATESVDELSPEDAAASAASVFPFEQFSGLQGCASGASLDYQKTTLVAMSKTVFAGMTAYDEEKPRITHLGGTSIDPTARDHRPTKGVRLVIEFNGDDHGGVFEKKASVDLWMREAYNVLFTSGCDLLSLVEISGYGAALGRHPIGPAALSWAITFKTKMTKDVAETVDWEAREELDFDDVWETMILNYRWEQALKGTPVGQ
jgi:hypothetical protein